MFDFEIIPETSRLISSRVKSATNNKRPGVAQNLQRIYHCNDCIIGVVLISGQCELRYVELDIIKPNITHHQEHQDQYTI